jgi:hypothetical protein
LYGVPPQKIPVLFGSTPQPALPKYGHALYDFMLLGSTPNNWRAQASPHMPVDFHPAKSHAKILAAKIWQDTPWLNPNRPTSSIFWCTPMALSKFFYSVV